MKQFNHLNASSVEEASKAAQGGTAMFIAGGTDLLGTLKDEILRDYPKTVVNLKTIPGLSGIQDKGDYVSIGALTTLDEVANSEIVKEKFSCLATAAAKVSAPTQRHMGTIGGNICQMHRCWYFRIPDNRFDCFRKGGDYCPAMLGDCRYHSIFGPDGGCIAASPHDTAPALIALDATIVTNKAEYAAESFFAVNGPRSNVLADGEVVTEIKVPNKATKSAFLKYAMRKTIDFAIVNCAVAKTDEGVRVVLGGVAPKPVRCEAAEAEVASKITADTAKKAGDAAVANATPFPKTEYKVEIARTLVKRALLEIS